MNSEEYINLLFKFISSLSIMQIIFLVLAGIFLWVIPDYILQRAIIAAKEKGKKISEVNKNAIFPYPKEISLISKLAIIGCFICAFIMGIIAVVIGQP